MMITARSRERVADWLADLRDRYGTIEVIDKRWELAPEAYDATYRRVEAGENGGAGGWITNDGGAVLLVRDEGAAGWSDPGGKREQGESFEAAAEREVREETGVEWRLDDALEAHRLEMVDRTDADRPTLYSLIVILTGDHVGGGPRPREGEIAEVGWFEAPPDAVAYPEVARRPYPASE